MFNSDFSSGTGLDDFDVMFDLSVDFAATALLFSDDDVPVSLSAVLGSSGPLLDSLIGNTNSNLLFLDDQLSFRDIDLSCLNSPSIDLASSATAFLWNLVDSDGDNLTGLITSSDSVLDNNLSVFELDNSSVDSDLCVDSLDSLARALVSSNDNDLGLLASGGSIFPGLDSELNNLCFSLGSLSLDDEDLLLLLLDSNVPSGDSLGVA